MQNKLDKYTGEVKAKLDKNFLSPLFIRLANLLYGNSHYDECIAVCKTGLEVYPNYLTAKLILLKAFLKAEYLNEAESLFREIKPKITNNELLDKLKNSIRSLQTISRQEKIYYPKSVKCRHDFKTFEKSFHGQENLFTNYTLDTFLDDSTHKSVEDETEFRNFLKSFEEFHFNKDNLKKQSLSLPELEEQTSSGKSSEDLLYKIKIVTETLADIYAEQGNFKDAFDAYNILLRAGSSNSKRIEEKLYELERSMIRHD